MYTCYICYKNDILINLSNNLHVFKFAIETNLYIIRKLKIEAMSVLGHMCMCGNKGFEESYEQSP